MAAADAESKLREALASAKETSCQEPDESRPYQFKYDAADALESALKELDLGESDGAAALKATAKCRRGLILLETDLLAEGEASIKDGLPALEAYKAANAELLLEAYNALGALWNDRGDTELATQWLLKSQALYEDLVARAPDGGQTPQAEMAASAEGGVGAAAAAAAAAAASDHTPLPARLGPAVERLHTSTLFYLAQVYAHSNNKGQSALYCAATLSRQLRVGEYSVTEWVQNCLQLSGYFLSVNAFAVSQYCLSAVDVLLAQRCAERQKRDAEAAAEAAEAAAAASSSNTAGSQPPPPPPSQQPRLPEDEVDDDVAANIQLAWGKLYLHRLQASLAHSLDNTCVTCPFPDAPSFPPQVRFHTLPGLPQPADLPWGAAALAASFDGARDLFNLALPRFKRALDFYTLDGWVTEHVRLAVEVSNLWRCLAGFEPDLHRRCVMHKSRTKLLEPLIGQLNPDHYLGLVRSVDLELGNIYRELIEQREDAADEERHRQKAAGGSGGGGGASPLLGPKEEEKIASYSRSATKHYQAFLDSFNGADSSRPDRVDPDNEEYYLQACFSMGRIIWKGNLAAKNDASGLQKTVEHLSWVLSYVKRNDVTAFEQEARLAQELVDLLAEKMVLVRRSAAEAAATQARR